MKKEGTVEKMITDRIAKLSLERQIRIFSYYPKFGTIANAARIINTQPKRKVIS